MWGCGIALVWSQMTPACPLQAMGPSLFEAQTPHLSQAGMRPTLVSDFEDEIRQQRERLMNNEPL